MKNKTKKLSALLVAALLSLSIFPLGALAEEIEATDLAADEVAVVTVEDDAALEQEAAIPEATAPEEFVAPATESAAVEPAPAAEATEPAPAEVVEPVIVAEPEPAAAAPAAALQAAPAAKAPVALTVAPRAKLTDYVFGLKDVAVQNGKYSFQLILKDAGGLVFDNDLSVLYQGVSGKYSLHYDMVSNENHIMVATGKFDNVLANSPLLQKYSSKISNDSYAYQLNLRTTEGFTFNNKLSYRYNGVKQSFAVDFKYDKLSNSQTLRVSGLPGNNTIVINGLSVLR